MDNLTRPLESATRTKINRILKNLGWNIDEFSKDCNVFTERVRTKEEKAKITQRFPKGRFPDYVLYSSLDLKPLAIIEAKRIGIKLDKAIKQAIDYAECIDAKVVFAVDGGIVEVRWVEEERLLKLDGQLVTELLPEKTLLRFINTGNELSSPQKVTKTKEDLIRIFARANDLLRQEGMREGIERFTEFSNFLFLKLIDEIEATRESKGEPRRIEARYSWSAFCDKEPQDMLDYINDTVLPKLVDKYNHSGDVFSSKLIIKNANILKQIVDELSKLTLLDVDSDVKGDAFEYFLKNSVTVGNDLGEYYTPRHIVKLMVDLVNPKYGDKVYDPCCGTGGFLIEAFRHIKQACNPTKNTLKVLENDTIFGGELTGTAKIAKMNMILAGDGHTHIIQQDSLQNRKDNDYDTILTNFPFSQKTEFSHLYGLSAKQANPVFVKHALDALRPGGWAGIVVPDSILFAKDIDYVKVRRQLVEECQIEAIIQLSVHTFSPYTKQPTSIIIFKKGGKTKNVWFFEVNNDGFIGTTKRRPFEKNDLPLLRSLWNDKSDSNLSFTLNYDDIKKDTYKLFLNHYKAYEKVKSSIELGELCDDFIIGHTPSKTNDDFYGGPYLWANISDMGNKYITDTQIKLSELGFSKMTERRLIKSGSLLMSFKLTIGKTAFVAKDLFTNEAICALKLKDKYNTDEIKEYLYHVLPVINYKPFAQRAAKGLTLNKDLIPTVEIPFPNKNEREKVIQKKLELMEEKEKLQKTMEDNLAKFDRLIKSEILGYK
ncbi:MAG TPA: N-6 DNA methylase [Candidatus Aquicultor sp.]|jgi:type I restriction enzyme M protein